VLGRGGENDRRVAAVVTDLAALGHPDVRLSGAKVSWGYALIAEYVDEFVTTTTVLRPAAVDDLSAYYVRLAQAYRARPRVPDYGGGVPGEAIRF
jgi:hypothetical protein